MIKGTADGAGADKGALEGCTGGARARGPSSNADNVDATEDSFTEFRGGTTALASDSGKRGGAGSSSVKPSAVANRRNMAARTAVSNTGSVRAHGRASRIQACRATCCAAAAAVTSDGLSAGTVGAKTEQKKLPSTDARCGAPLTGSAGPVGESAASAAAAARRKSASVCSDAGELLAGRELAQDCESTGASRVHVDGESLQPDERPARTSATIPGSPGPVVAPTKPRAHFPSVKHQSSSFGAMRVVFQAIHHRHEYTQRRSHTHTHARAHERTHIRTYHWLSFCTQCRTRRGSARSQHELGPGRRVAKSRNDSDGGNREPSFPLCNETMQPTTAFLCDSHRIR